jgi:anti-sigma factor RsiW
MSGYLEAELGTIHRSRMERHLVECHQCRRLLAGLRATLVALHRLAVSDDRADSLRIAAAVRGRLTEPPPR